MKKSDKNNLSVEIKRHSFAHVMAAAIKEIFPKAHFGVGPALENGFYYDLELPHQLKIEELALIEKRMRDIVSRKTPFVRRKLNLAEAKKIFVDLGEPYKLELIHDVESHGTTKYDEIQENSSEAKKRKVNFVTIYKTGEFIDLCRGPHVKNTSFLSSKAFKLTKIAGAYWRGDEKNPMLQRIYGVAFDTEEELKKYLTQQEEAKKRDHRKLGKELGLFVFSDLVGPGLPLYTFKGAFVLRKIKEYSNKLRKEMGYQEVQTPQINKAELFKISGHYDKYKNDMFNVTSHYSNEEYFLKPMNCPQHTQIFGSEKRSYKDLPIRIADFSMLYRDEKPGELSGLTRLRSFSQDDSHCFCREDQLEEEFNKLLDAIAQVMKTYAMEYSIRLSLRDPKKKKNYLGDDKTWEKSQKMLKKLLVQKKINFLVAEGEAAFYGPKMDLLACDSLGRSWQLSTVQLDLNMPQRFGLEYTDQTGKNCTPIMIHSALVGSPERMLGVLIEHYSGAFPFWMAKTQIAVATVGRQNQAYALAVAKELQENNFRVEILDGDDTVGKKIFYSETQKIPYTIVVGDKETKQKSVALRQRGKRETEVLKLNKVMEKFKKEQNPLV